MSSVRWKSSTSLVLAEDVAWQSEADIVVVGSGAAGFSAALNAARLGNSVIILEKAPQIGGTTAKAAAWYWMPNNSLMRQRGLSDPKPDALRYMARLSRPYLYNPNDPHLGLPAWEYSLIEAFYDNAATANDTLAEMGALRPTIAEAITPDYYALLPENKAPYGRVLFPEDPNGPGNTHGGVEMIRQLKAAADARNIPLLLNHRVQRVVLNSAGEVVGVQAITADGGIAAFRARKAVIFGSGGFTHNAELRQNFLKGPVFGGCAALSNEGDFIKIATELGAELRNMNYAWWAPLPLEKALENASSLSSMFAPPGDSMLFVNKYGQRVVNEKVQYNEQTQVFFQWDPFRAEYPNLVLVLLYDQRVADLFAGNDYGNPVPPEGFSTSHVISGKTLDDLTQNIKERLRKLANWTGNFQLDATFGSRLPQTIQRFNEFARNGRDLDFHRGEAPIEQYFNGPARPGNEKNATMHPLSESGPYYAILIVAGTLDTKGGPKTNAKAQILDTEGKAIPGLYGAGNCVASPSAQAYWAGGATIGPALTFGYIAAVNASQEPIKAVEQLAGTKSNISGNV